MVARRLRRKKKRPLMEVLKELGHPMAKTFLNVHEALEKMASDKRLGSRVRRSLATELEHVRSLKLEEEAVEHLPGILDELRKDDDYKNYLRMIASLWARSEQVAKLQEATRETIRKGYRVMAEHEATLREVLREVWGMDPSELTPEKIEELKKRLDQAGREAALRMALLKQELERQKMDAAVHARVAHALIPLLALAHRSLLEKLLEKLKKKKS